MFFLVNIREELCVNQINVKHKPCICFYYGKFGHFLNECEEHEINIRKLEQHHCWKWECYNANVVEETPTNQLQPDDSNA